MNIGIVGLGLIGASTAKAIKKYTQHQVFALDKDTEVEALARKEKSIDGILNQKTISQCRIIFLALYPKATLDFLHSHSDFISPQTIVVDFCGVKSLICREASPLAVAGGFHFIGGHPMAGREQSGYQAATADLFRGAPILLTPQTDTPPEVLSQLQELCLELKFSHVHLTDAKTHDEIIAYTSQLAHILSNAYVKSPAALEYKNFAGGSFQNLTRVAFLKVDMWSELFLLNKNNLVREIDQLCSRLEEYSQALKANDEERLAHLLEEGCLWKKKASATSPKTVDEGL